MTASRRVAAIDCGTNSVRLLIGQARPGGGFDEIDRRLHLTRLGQGVDATGEFHPDALARTMAALDDYATRIADAGADRVRFVATSAARDARNRDAFFDGVRARLGVDAEVIAGKEEALLSFTGALSAIPDAPGLVVVMDIGGGSTELVLGTGGATPTIDAAVSLDIGSVRLRERLLHSDPPTASQMQDATAHVDALLAGSGVDLGSAATWIGVGGTATSLSALAQGLASYDRAGVHGSVLPRSTLDALAASLLASSVAQVLEYPTMVPGRADVICAGALIAQLVGERTGLDLTVSESDILDGLVLGLLTAQ